MKIIRGKGVQLSIEEYEKLVDIKRDVADTLAQIEALAHLERQVHTERVARLEEDLERTSKVLAILIRMLGGPTNPDKDPHDQGVFLTIADKIDRLTDLSIQWNRNAAFRAWEIVVTGPNVGLEVGPDKLAFSYHESTDGVGFVDTAFEPDTDAFADKLVSFKGGRLTLEDRPVVPDGES